MGTPPASDPAIALEQALRARRARAALKRMLRSGERTPVQVLQLSEGDALAGSLRVSEFLAALRGIGPVKRDALMQRLGIAEAKRLGGLGALQRRRLHDYLVHQWRPAAGARSTPRLIVLAGPTAVGKGTVVQHIREHHPEVQISISATTRPPRPGEVDGASYFFVTEQEFDRLVAMGRMLEWAQVHGAHRYGTPRDPVEAALNAGRSVLLEIDLQGARQVRAAMPEAVLVFLLPPSWDELVQRLIGRGTETLEEQARRLETAREELAAQDEFDVRIVNREVAEAAEEVVQLIGSPVFRGDRGTEE